MDYNKRRWKKLRESILRADGYIDRIEKRYGKNIEANTVHHIYPVREYPQYAFEPWNLISLNSKTHNRMHNRDTDELTAEGKELMRRTIPGKDWRKK